MAERGPAERDRAELEASLARHREEFGRAVGTLADVAVEDVVPRAAGSLLSKGPYAWLAGAFVIGAWIGSRRSNRSHR